MSSEIDIIRVVRLVGQRRGVISCGLATDWGARGSVLSPPRACLKGARENREIPDRYWTEGAQEGVSPRGVAGGGRSPPARRPHEKVWIARPVRACCPCGHRQIALG
jgi:hypothetical protein